MAETLKPDSKTRDLDFCKCTLDNFELYYRKRTLRQYQVEDLLKVLNSGKSIESQMVVTQDTKTGIITIIDGQHRYEAIKKYLENHPDTHIKIHAEYYNDLSNEEQFRIYLIHAKVIGQKMADMLTMGVDWIYIAKKLEEDFPVRVTHGKTIDAWVSKHLINAYLFREKPPENTGSYRATIFIDIAKTLKEEDGKRLEAFCVMHQEIFGDPGTGNKFCTYAALNSLMKIWFYNIDECRCDPKFLKERIRKLIGDSKIMNAGKYTDRDHLKDIYDHMLRKINRGLSKNKIEAIPEK